MPRRILLVDDEYLTLAILEDTLTARGYEIITAGRASTAFDQALYGAPDLIILDIILPDGDGLAVLRRLRENDRTRDIPVVLLSALSASRAFEGSGAAAFLHKPIVPDAVVEAVRGLIGPADGGREGGPGE